MKMGDKYQRSRPSALAEQEEKKAKKPKLSEKDNEGNYGKVMKSIIIIRQNGRHGWFVLSPQDNRNSANI